MVLPVARLLLYEYGCDASPSPTELIRSLPPYLVSILHESIHHAPKAYLLIQWALSLQTAVIDEDNEDWRMECIRFSKEYFWPWPWGRPDSTAVPSITLTHLTTLIAQHRWTEAMQFISHGAEHTWNHLLTSTADVLEEKEATWMKLWTHRPPPGRPTPFVVHQQRRLVIATVDFHRCTRAEVQWIIHGLLGLDAEVVTVPDVPPFTERLPREVNEVLERADVVVCVYPASACLNFVHFNIPMALVFTAPFDLDFRIPNLHIGNHNTSALLATLATVMDDPKHLVVANTQYDAAYLHWYTGLRMKVSTMYTGFANSTYSPSLPSFMVGPYRFWRWPQHQLANTLMELNGKHDFPLIFDRMYFAQYEWQDLTKYSGFVLLPYTHCSCFFQELYAMNIPIFYPSVSLLAKWCVAYDIIEMELRTLDDQFVGIDPPENSSLPHPNELSEEAVSYWYGQSLYYDLPHIIYFDSFEELLHLMRTVDLVAVSTRMAAYNQRRIRHYKHVWSSFFINAGVGMGA